MTCRTFFVVSMFLLFHITVQRNTTGSGSNDEPAPMCTKAKIDDICNIIGSSTDHLVVNTEEITEIFRTLYLGSENSTYICRQFIIFSACFYTFRSCDDSGAQIFICEDACPRISELYHDCVSESIIERLINSTDNPEVLEFLEFSLTFDCYKKESYVIEGIEISHSCQDFQFIHDFFPESDDSTSKWQQIVGITLGIVLPLLLICIVLILIVVIVRQYTSKRRMKRRMTAQINEYNPHIGSTADIIPGKCFSIEDIKLSAEEQCFYEERFGKAVIPYTTLSMEESIGEGTFGVVCKATLSGNSFTQPVAVKKARNLSSKQQLRSLLSESLLMKRFDHPNIVGLLGVCFDTPDDFPYLILPFMTNGNIRDFLKDKRMHSTVTASLPNGITMKSLTTMCYDVAKGMEYLSSNKFVHRDLAARNCMMDEQGVVKVGDFGLARDVYAHLYYRGDKHSKIPVKWSAPEMLNDGLCTELSDVWSYGVVCWEIFSLGTTPYPGVDNYDIPQYIARGKRLKKPVLCPQNMFLLMETCWKLKPETRPNFKDLVVTLSTHL